MKRARDDEDSIIAITFSNEDGLITGYLICEKSKLTEDELATVKSLEGLDDYEEVRKIGKVLKKDKILSESMCYRDDDEWKAFKFRHIKSLADPPLKISCLVAALGT